MIKSFGIYSLGVVACLAGMAHTGEAAGPIVAIPNVGKVEGLDLGTLDAPFNRPTLVEFRGIPFAQPPVGPLRWQPPVAHPGWGEETFNATEFGHSCMQAPQPLLATEPNEDCLFLNIVVPKSALEEGAAKLPVMVWIHGGGYYVGSGAEIENRRAALVSSSDDSVIVVSMNYRLNIYGWLASAEIMERTDGEGAGNFGIMDQRLALEWLQANIGAFGRSERGREEGAGAPFRRATHHEPPDPPLLSNGVRDRDHRRISGAPSGL